MSTKQGHEALESYVDNLRVKISERYKPPPRINLPMTYAQRLTLNKHIQDNIPNYHFHLEKTVVGKMKDWKSARTILSNERKIRLEKVREEIKSRELERIEQDKLNEAEVKTVDETVTTMCNNNFGCIPTNLAYDTGAGMNYSTNTTILMPTQAPANYSNILTPIPLNNCVNKQYNSKSDDKSPFNLSDFENDTSSPFDNMELKSINDMEELAQVLKGERAPYNVNTSTYPIYQPAVTQHTHPNYSSYLGNQYAFNIPNSVSYMQPVTSNYTSSNGYYFTTPAVSLNQPVQLPYSYTKPSYTNYTASHGTSLKEIKKSNCKSVPDIVNSLQVELENSHLDNMLRKKSYVRDNAGTQTNRPKSTDAIYSKARTKVEQLDDPFSLLTEDQQVLCRSISSMGFPLSRVARTCKMLGDDHKKIVEHLLALSDLLDLGFSEKDISSALLQCGNDRDKALDKLVS